jgi:hypothetical protein
VKIRKATGDRVLHMKFYGPLLIDGLGGISGMAWCKERRQVTAFSLQMFFGRQVEETVKIVLANRVDEKIVDQVGKVPGDFGGDTASSLITRWAGKGIGRRG